MPKAVQPDAKKPVHEMHLSPTLKGAKMAFAEFQQRYGAKCPKAVECQAPASRLVR